MANKEIARELGLSHGTVKLHVHHIFLKLGGAKATHAHLFALGVGQAAAIEVSPPVPPLSATLKLAKRNYQQSAMNERIHYDITRRLDSIKASGLITDYWVSWVGLNGDLRPKVCSWTMDRHEVRRTHDQVTLIRNGLAARENIIMRPTNLA